MGAAVIVLFLLFLAYLVPGGVIFHIWVRRTRRGPPPAQREDPVLWVRYWLPVVVAAQIYAGLGAAYMCFVLFTASALRDPYTKLGMILGLILFALIFVAFDVAMIARVRFLTRNQRPPSR